VLVKFGSTAGVEESDCGGGDWRRWYSSRMSPATSLQGVVWLSASKGCPGSIWAGPGLSPASALVPDFNLTPGGLPVRGLVLQCLSSSRRSVEPAALFNRKHVVRTWRTSTKNIRRTVSRSTRIHRPVEASMCNCAAMSVGETPAP
jgi:hypothetical protein